MGTAVRPAKTSPGSWDAFADVDAFVDEVLAELEAMAKDGSRPMRSGPKLPLAEAALRKALADFQTRPMLAQWQRGMAVVEHMHVLTQAQKVRYRRLLQPFDPGVADEFAICCQRSHRLMGERRLEDLHQINPLGGIGIARLVEDTPKQWDAHVAMSHAQHQYVQIGLAKLPVGALNRQMPRLGAQRHSRHHQARNLSLVQPHIAKEPGIMEQPPPDAGISIGYQCVGGCVALEMTVRPESLVSAC